MPKWPDEEIDRLRWLDELGEPHAATARALGRTERSVANKCHKLGLSVPRNTGPLDVLTLARAEAVIHDQRVTIRKLTATIAELRRQLAAAGVVA
jgi:hypothetical protein